MYYYFDLKIELYEPGKPCLLNRDITGFDCSQIQGLLAEYPTAYSGAILASYEGRDLDGIPLRDLVKEDFNHQSFINWVLETNNLAYDVHEQMKAQAELDKAKKPNKTKTVQLVSTEEQAAA